MDEKKSNLRLIQDNDAKTRYYTGLPTFAVFTAVLKFIEPYITVARQRLSDPDNSSKGRKNCLSTGEEFFSSLDEIATRATGRCSRSLLHLNLLIFTYIQDLDQGASHYTEGHISLAN